MTVLIHPEAGPGVGLEHLSRCLALAQALRAAHAEPVFLVADDPPAVARLAQAGFRQEVSGAPFGSSEDDRLVQNLADRLGADVVVMDGHSVEGSTLSDIRDSGRVLLILDDHGRYDLPADFILDAGARPLPQNGGAARLMLGPRFALLQEPFWEVTPRVRSQVKRVLVIVGSVDPDGLTRRLMHVLDGLPGDFTLHVAVGPNFEDRAEIERLATAARRPVQVDDALLLPCGLIQQADLAISAAGDTLLELAACGVPTIAIRTDGARAHSLAALAEAGAVMTLPLSDVLAGPEPLIHALTALWPHPRREQASAAARGLVDGRGAVRVAQALLARTVASAVSLH